MVNDVRSEHGAIPYSRVAIVWLVPESVRSDFPYSRSRTLVVRISMAVDALRNRMSEEARIGMRSHTVEKH